MPRTAAKPRKTTSAKRTSPKRNAGVDRRLKALDSLMTDGRPRGQMELAAMRRQMDDLANGHERGLVWDEEEAQRAVAFFSLLVHWKGHLANRPFILEPWQEHVVVGPLFGWHLGKPRSQGGRRRFRKAGIEIPRKNGKDSDIYTVIPTPSGSCRMGDLKVGDLVLDENGNPQTVTGIADWEGNACFCLEFSDGTHVVCGSNHEWQVAGWSRPYTTETHQLFRDFKPGRFVIAKPYDNEAVTITQVYPVPSRPTRCIEVSGPSHLYLCGKGAIPTHNSTLAAGLGLKCLSADGEFGSEVYSAATSRDQANIVFNTAQVMVGKKLRDPRSKHRIEVKKLTLYQPSSNSFFKSVASDSNSLWGFNTHCAIVDEFHAHTTRAVWDALLTSIAARVNPLVAWISTAGFDLQSIWYEEHLYCEEVLRGLRQDDSYFTYFAKADDDADWQDPQTWKAANPNFHLLSLEYFENLVQRAKDSPGDENSFRRLHLNQIVEQEVRVIPMHLWRECTTVQYEQSHPEGRLGWRTDYERWCGALEGRECYGALDLASTRDLGAWALVFPWDDGTFRVKVKCFAPKHAADQQARYERNDYLGWAERGLIELTEAYEGKVIDYKAVQRQMEEDMRRYRILGVAVDPWNIQAFYQQLVAAGWPGPDEDFFQEFRQSPQYFHDPMMTLIDKIKARKIDHAADPVLHWCMSNLVAKQDDKGFIRPDKKMAQQKIDPAVATIMAFALAINRQTDGYDDLNIYATPGMLTL